MVRKPRHVRRVKRVFLAISIFLSTGAFTDALSFSEGYVLAAAGRAAELFDNTGKAVFTWSTTATSGYSCYLLENGNLLRSIVAPNAISAADADAAPQQGTVEEVSPDKKILWSYTLCDKTYMMHHDFKPLPNGNILGVSFVTVDSADAFAAGVDRTVFSNMDMPRKTFQSEMIFELKPDKTGGKNHQIVWQWCVMDHVVPKEQAAAHPELFNGSHPTWQRFQGQWFHINGLDYDTKKDVILFSSRVFSEVYIIDHHTTTLEAAGHTGGACGKGGDVLYRWGCPANFGATGGTTINCLHCPTWITEGCPGAGDIMFFHNNVNPMMQQLGFSQVIELNPFDANGKLPPLTPGSPTAPLTPTWIYLPVDSMYSASMSTAIRLKSGNTIIHEAYPGGNHSGNNSTVREVTPAGALAGSKMILKQTGAYNPSKIMYYPNDYPGVLKLLGVPTEEKKVTGKGVVVPEMGITFRPGRINFSNVKNADIALFTLQGKKAAKLHAECDRAGIGTKQFAPGSYLVKVRRADGVAASRLVTIEQ